VRFFAADEVRSMKLRTSVRGMPNAMPAALQYNQHILINAPTAPLLHAADLSFRLA
jgi:hypothetical protein